MADLNAFERRKLEKLFELTASMYETFLIVPILSFSCSIDYPLYGNFYQFHQQLGDKDSN